MGFNDTSLWKWGKPAPAKPETNDMFMSLQLIASSMNSKAMVSDLTKSLLEKSHRKSATKKFEAAVAAIVGDLLIGANSDRYCYRTMGKCHFTGHRIGYQPAVDALRGLTAMGYAEHQPGFKCGANRDLKGQASRYRATKSFLEAALIFGVTPSTSGQHFHTAPVPGRVRLPIILRPKREYWQGGQRAADLAIDKSDPMYRAAAERVQRINDYMARQHITGCTPPRFQRIFNEADEPGFAWDKGGRLYAAGGGYQNMPSEERAAIRINGKPVCELDISSSHLTIVYALNRQQMTNPADLYSIDGVPRPVVKSWITMTLGYGQFHKDWPKQASTELATKYGISTDDYPIDGVRNAALNKHPLLSEFITLGVGWGRLQFLESEALLLTVETLAYDHNVTALPVHDSIVVPHDSLVMAESAMSNAFLKAVGTRPLIKLK